jgi:hypothetical protein
MQQIYFINTYFKLCKFCIEYLVIMSIRKKSALLRAKDEIELDRNRKLRKPPKVQSYLKIIFFLLYIYNRYSILYNKDILIH